MNRLTRNTMAAALAAAVALGVAAPAATAAPKTSHSKVDHRSTKAHKHESARKADRKLSAAERRLAQRAGAKSRYLDRLVDSRKVASLEDSAEGAVKANIGEDVNALQEMRSTAASADVKGLSAQLRSVRPEVYNTIINDLRLATRLDAALAKTSDPDPVLVAKLDALIETLKGYDAGTSRSELRQAMRQLSALVAAVSAAEADDEQEAPETGTENGTENGTDTGTETPVGDAGAVA